MLDRERILSKVAELDSYLRELDSIRPATRGHVDDDLVFLFLTRGTADFLLFRQGILEAVARHA